MAVTARKQWRGWSLEEMVVDGVKTNIPLHRRILSDPGFRNAHFNIHHLEKSILRG